MTTPLWRKRYIDLDPLWKFDSSKFTVKDQFLPSFFDPERKYSTISLFLTFQREGSGIIFRLALPILMFLLIVGFAFWSNIDKRVSVTTTMLLAVASFYLVIGSVIPFVGYFSLLDKFVTFAFCVLSAAAGTHYMTDHLDRNKYKYPINEFLRDLIVFLGRLLWAPFILTVGFLHFSASFDPAFAFLVSLVLLFTSVNTLVHWEEIDIVFRNKLCELRVKHYCRVHNLPFLENCKDENMLKGENEVTLDLTSSEIVIYSITCFLSVHCACDKKWREDLFISQKFSIKARPLRNGSENKENKNKGDDGVELNERHERKLDSAETGGDWKLASSRGGHNNNNSNNHSYGSVKSKKSEIFPEPVEIPQLEEENLCLVKENPAKKKPVFPKDDRERLKMIHEYGFYCGDLQKVIQNRTPDNNDDSDGYLRSCESRFCYHCRHNGGMRPVPL
jgi:hypothetical protein